MCRFCFTEIVENGKYPLWNSIRFQRERERWREMKSLFLNKSWANCFYAWSCRLMLPLLATFIYTHTKVCMWHIFCIPFNYISDFEFRAKSYLAGVWERCFFIEHIRTIIGTIFGSLPTISKLLKSSTFSFGLLLVYFCVAFSLFAP